MLHIGQALGIESQQIQVGQIWTAREHIGHISDLLGVEVR